MSITHTVWSLDEKAPLATADLESEKELELLLVDHVEVLNKNWLVVKNQVATDAGKFIDLLCMDHDGDMVVVELKKSLTPREVTAQVIDYAASVSKMSVEEIAQLYLEFTEETETLSEAFRRKFGTDLDESNINQNVKMVIVAAKMDDGTERIIRFLRETYQVDINILFFGVFQHGDQRFISRAWFEVDIEEEAAPAKVSIKRPWNGEYYASFGEGEGTRVWEDARRYGFFSAGGGSWYTKTLQLLTPGDRIWVNIPQKGYVGVGVVRKPAQNARDVMVEDGGSLVSLSSLPLQGNYHEFTCDSDAAEQIVLVNWLKTVDSESAVRELGFFGNQNSVCRPRTEKWDFTVNRLKKYWGIED